MRPSFYKNIIEALCALFILLFVYTAVSKLTDHTNFTAQLNFATQNETIAALLGWGVPLSEIVIAFMLCINTSRLAGLYAFVCLLFFFTAWIIYLLLSGRPLPCSCGGVIAALTWKQHLVFNGCFLLAGIAAIILQTTKLPAYPTTETNKSF